MIAKSGNGQGSMKLVLGVDIGGTNTKSGYVNREGNCLASTSIPTHGDRPADEFFNRLWGECTRLFDGLPEKCEVVGIGIGAPNANFYKSTIEHPPNLGWEYVDVRAEIGKYSNAPVAVTNDANAAALGEMLFGAAQGMKNFIVITLGTGLGSGIVANGELIYGADGFAGEIGHTTVVPNGRRCRCGNRGCLETYCSASGLCRTVQELLCDTTEPSELRNVSFAKLTAKMVCKSAEHGDRLALQAFESCGETLGLKLADSVAHLSPEAIILVGGMAAAGDLIFAPTKRSLEKYVFPTFRNKVKILPTRLKKGSTAILGASALIWKAMAGVS
jgi:glucokinase